MVFFESGHKSQGRAYNRIAQEVAEIAERVSFSPKTKTPLLQAADLLAWQTRKYVQDSGSRAPRRDFLSLMEHRHVFYTVLPGGDTGFELWPLDRRSAGGFQGWSIEREGPITLLRERGGDDEGLPIIPIRKVLGWRPAIDKAVYIRLRAMGPKDFALMLDQVHLLQLAILLLEATAGLANSGIATTIPAVDVKVVNTGSGGERGIAVKLATGMSIVLELPPEAFKTLEDSL